MRESRERRAPDHEANEDNEVRQELHAATPAT